MVAEEPVYPINYSELLRLLTIESAAKAFASLFVDLNGSNGKPPLVSIECSHLEVQSLIRGALSELADALSAPNALSIPA